MVEELKTRIDECAQQCCTLMSDKERERFFKYQEERIDSGQAFPAKYTSIRQYYKGRKKGEKKEVWNIDGVKFKILWNMLKPYAYQSAMNSHGFNSYDLEEDMSEIMLWLFKIMRFFGPEPTGVTVSNYFPLLVNNYFTNLYNTNRRKTSSKEDLLKFEIRKMFKKYKKEGKSDMGCYMRLRKDYGMDERRIKDIVENVFETQYKTQSLFEEVGSVEEEEVCIINKIPQNDYNIYFTVDFPSELRYASELLMGGMKMREVAVEVGIPAEELRARYEECFQ